MNPLRWATLAAVLAGCTRAPHDVDAGADAGGPEDTGTAAWPGPALPAPPAPPVLTPCPTGWREVVDGDATTCDPWPIAGHRTDCALDEAQFPGEPGCTRIGTACAVDGWPSDLPTGRAVVYVDDGAAPGGDGHSRAAAFASLAAAMTAAPAGAVIAVATGTYDVSRIDVRTGQSLWGACVTGTRLTSHVADGIDGVVDLVGDGAELRNLAIDTPDRPGIRTLGDDATVRDVAVTGALTYGLEVVRSGTIENVVIRDSRDAARLFRAMWLDTTDASLTARRLAIERVRDDGILVDGNGAHLDLDEAVIDGVGPGALGAGHGLQVYNSGTATLRHVAIARVQGSAIALRSGSPIVDAHDLVVRDITSDSSGSHGEGALVAHGALLLERAWIGGTRLAGLDAASTGARLVVRDVVVRDVEDEAADALGGFGLALQTGGTATLERVSFARTRALGLFVTDAGSRLDGTDVTVRDVSPPRTPGPGGRGINVQSGASATLLRVAISNTIECGLYASMAETFVDGTDIAIRTVRSRPVDGLMGGGVWAQLAHMTLLRVSVEDVHLAGITSTGGEIHLTDATVHGVAASECAPACADIAGGFGLVGVFSGVLDVHGLDVTDLALCGAVVGTNSVGYPPTAVDLDLGWIDRAPIGACVQVGDYDTARLRHAMEYRAVGVPLQATSYTLPASL